MDSRFLQTFVAVVEHGSIAEAARHLGLTHTSVAQRLHALERDIGSPLVARAGRTVKPTAAGLRILERARGILHAVRDLRSEASGNALPAGPLRLGATPTGLTGICPPVLRRWAARHPDIEIFIEPGTTTALYDRVLAGALDAAILVHPLFDLPKTCGWQALREEPLVLLTAAGQAVDDPLRVLATQPLIRYDRQVVAGRMADDYLRAHQLRPRVSFELDGIESIAKLVAEGLGVSVLPDWAIVGDSPSGFRKWPLPPPCPARTVGVLWLRGGMRAPLARIFTELALAGAEGKP